MCRALRRWRYFCFTGGGVPGGALGGAPAASALITFTSKISNELGGIFGWRSRAVGEFRRYEQLPFRARLHQHQRFLPALDDAVHGKGRGHAARIRTVEFRAVDQLAAIVHGHAVGSAMGGAFLSPAARILYCSPEAVLTTPFSLPFFARNSFAAFALRAAMASPAERA